jgi:hypothetical protein
MFLWKCRQKWLFVTSLLAELTEDGHYSLVEYHGNKIPYYAILSHTWGVSEVTFKDITEDTGKDKSGYEKIHFLAQDKLPEMDYDISGSTPVASITSAA